VTRVGLGTNRLTDSDENRAFLRGAVEAGIEMIDTAHLYTGGSSEMAIGNALSPFPDSVLVATKGGFGGGSGTTTEELRAELDQSFKRLQTDQIGLYYVHRLHAEVPIAETMELLAEYVDAGRIENVGLSEVTVEKIEEARQTLPIAAVQNEYSHAERKHDEVLDYCEAEGIAFVPFFPLRAADDRPVSDLIAWLLDRSPAMLPIPGTLSLDHVRENLRALVH
jgi:aryl-alcohol dehydrogenase-like predicted oxidoreductase